MNDNNTVVINLFGGSGCGKSTTAALLYSRLKILGNHVELVREYVKNWAWNNRKPGEWDPLYFLGKQSSYESLLYGKVDYIVTDSPLLLVGVYQEFNLKGRENYVSVAAQSFILHAQKHGIIYKNFFLKRNKPFDPRGRYETEEQAKQVDDFILSTLKGIGDWASPVMITGPDSERDLEILNYIC
jgi:hypothetical protein